MAFTRVANVQNIPPSTAKQVSVGDRKLALFNVNGTYYAIDDTCSHRGASLSEGELAETIVTCPWHGARFDVAPGSHLSPPAPRAVASYPVQVMGDEIQVDVP